MEILKYLSNNIKENIINNSKEKFNDLEEIRIRNNKNIILKFNQKEEIIRYIVTTKDILETLEKITENSIYSYEKQISERLHNLTRGTQNWYNRTCSM